MMALLDGRVKVKAKTGILIFSVVSVITIYYSNVITEHLTSFQLPIEDEDDIKRILLPNLAPKWVALWIPSETKADVTHFTEIPGWKTVVVGDGRCPVGCRFPKCVFIDVPSQALLGPSVTSLLPSDHPSRKNLAYLYAIRQKARFIYDAHHTIVRANLSSFYYGDSSGVVFAGTGVFNYYKHYGEHTLLPPGFVDIGPHDDGPPQYVMKDVPHPEVQHALWKVKVGGPRFQSAGATPLVFVGSTSFVPFDGRNTLFRRRSFWGLLTLPIPSGDIIRSYILQALLKHFTGFVGILPPTGETSDYVSSNPAPAYNKLKRLVVYLYKWRCTDRRSITSCQLKLATDLAREGFINETMVKIVVGWTVDLQDAGYDKMASSVDDWPRSRTGNRYTSNNPGVMYYNNPSLKTDDGVKQICNNFTYPNTTKHKFRHILLIVTFNYVFLYQNIAYVEGIYRHYFPNILFCGPDIKAFRNATSSLPKHASVFYVSGLKQTWKYFQECTVYAMKMNLDLEGYLQIGEDTLLNPWNLWNLPTDQIWIDHKTYQLSRYKYNRWTWWSQSIGRIALDKVFSHIESFVRKPGSSTEKNFYVQYVKNVGNFTAVFRKRCDFFYIPTRLKYEFIYMTNIFINSSLIVEVAIPTMILGLDGKEKITRVNGFIAKGNLKNMPERFFNANGGHYIHSFKGIQQMKRVNCRQFLCKTYLPTLVERMESVTIKNGSFSGVGIVIS